MIGTSCSAYAPMRVKCIQRCRLASSWSPPSEPSWGVVNSSFVAIALSSRYCPWIGWPAVPTYDRIADLPIEIEGYALAGLERDVSSEFTRLSTVIRLRGAGHEGVGEDVTYDALDHVALQDAGPVHDLTPAQTVGELCDLVESLDLFPAAPVRDVSRLYRTWAFESAALDLALRQTGRSLSDHLGREPQPVNFVV